MDSFIFSAFYILSFLAMSDNLIIERKSRLSEALEEIKKCNLENTLHSVLQIRLRKAACCHPSLIPSWRSLSNRRVLLSKSCLLPLCDYEMQFFFIIGMPILIVLSLRPCRTPLGTSASIENSKQKKFLLFFR
jgi:hypothetical protein